MKKRFAAALALILMIVPLVSGCKNTAETNIKTRKLTVWVSSREYASPMENQFVSDHPGVDWGLDVRVVEPSQMAEKLEEAQRTGVDLPDVFMLSPEQLPVMINSDDTADLNSLGLVFDPTRYCEYAFLMGKTADGSLKAVCWQVDPVMFFYRRSLARRYLGTDDPDNIAPMLADWDSFLETARIIRDKSIELTNGRTRMTAGLQDVLIPRLSCLDGGWTGGGGELVMPDGAEELFDFALLYKSENLCRGAEQLSEMWIAGISDPFDVFGYFASPIGMKNILKKACTVKTADGEVSSFGDWAAVEGPAAYNQGGAWLAAYGGSEMREEAAVFIGYFASEQSAMRKFFLQSGATPADINVAEHIKFDPQFGEPFLGGQNYFAVATSAADKIPPRTAASRFDQRLKYAFCDAAEAYADGYKDRGQAVDDFTASAQQIIGL